MFWSRRCRLFSHARHIPASILLLVNIYIVQPERDGSNDKTRAGRKLSRPLGGSLLSAGGDEDDAPWKSRDGLGSPSIFIVVLRLLPVSAIFKVTGNILFKCSHKVDRT
jgi:hypothetical protein